MYLITQNKRREDNDEKSHRPAVGYADGVCHGSLRHGSGRTCARTICTAGRRCSGCGSRRTDPRLSHRHADRRHDGLHRNRRIRRVQLRYAGQRRIRIASGLPGYQGRIPSAVGSLQHGRRRHLDLHHSGRNDLVRRRARDGRGHSFHPPIRSGQRQRQF